MRTITTADLARNTGAHRTTIVRVAGRLNLGQKIGVQILFTAAEAEQIAAEVRPGQPGNPRIAEQAAAGVAARKKNRK